MGRDHDGRGILYPAMLPSLHRVPPAEGLDGLVRWFWIPRWEIAPGRTSRQQILPFPSSNLVVEPDGVTLVGPSTGASHRDLRGRGWAVGALLRPAAIAQFVPEPGGIRDASTRFEAPKLYDAVASAMRDADETAGHERAAALFGEWATARLAPPDELGALANAMEDLIASDREIVRVEQAAERLGISVRALQRIARRYVGLSPLRIIRRYRLQEAAQRLRDDSGLTIARVAADLGYADHAHLTADFRHVLGMTPSSYRVRPNHGR